MAKSSKIKNSGSPSVSKKSAVNEIHSGARVYGMYLARKDGSSSYKINPANDPTTAFDAVFDSLIARLGKAVR